MDQSFDAVIIGSGFGGALAARALVEAGWGVLLVERGDWVPRGEAASRPENFATVSPHYARDAGYRVLQDGRRPSALGALFCVGGASVFYGGVSFRLREQDFTPPPEIVADSGAEWPIRYGDLEPHYARAERILGVSGVAAADPTEPWRSSPYPATPAARSVLSGRIARAAERLGLHPFPLPMAIHHGGENGRSPCIRCGACDGFACPVEAKNDLATRVIAPLLGQGLTLLTQTAAVQLVERECRITEVECIALGPASEAGRRFSVRGREVLLAAGSLATPHLLLASGLERRNPGGQVVGRFLMRHVNSGIYGLWLRRSPHDGMTKEIGIHDYYPGAADAPPGPLGSIQSWPVPPHGIARIQAPAPLAWLADHLLLPRSAGLLIIAEDQPQFANRVELDPAVRDAAGLPGLLIRHRYSSRDRAANRALKQRARRILRQAGALPYFHLPIRTFSHALGTVRMGCDAERSALDAECRYRGVENLRVVDGSVFPTSAAVNPSLTIAANALRVASALLSGGAGTRGASSRATA